MTGDQPSLFGDSDDERFRLPDEVPISSLFIDESGAKNSRGGFFVVVFVKTRETAQLDRDIRHLRQKHKFFREAKFGHVNQESLPFHLDLVEMVAAADVRVGGSVYDSTKSFVGRRATWEVQAGMSAQLVLGNVNKGELVNVFLDLVTTPVGESVASRVQEEVNRKLGSRVVAGCYDLDSNSTNLLQVADVVAGSIAYARRTWEGDTPDAPRSERTPKAKVAGRLRRALELEDYCDRRAGKVNILTMRHS